MKLCWPYRKLISYRVEAVDAEPALLRRHLAQCEECREFSGRQISLTTKLTAHANAYAVATPRFLHGKIMAALARDADCRTSEGKSFPIFRWFALPAAGVLLVVLSWRWHAASPSTFSPAQVDGRATVLIEPGASANDSHAGEKLLAWCKNLNQPLETELYLVASDAQTALSSLGEKFLPQAAKAIDGF